MTGNGFDYRDAAMFTESGYSCLSWLDVMDQQINPMTYPDAGKWNGAILWREIFRITQCILM